MVNLYIIQRVTCEPQAQRDRVTSQAVTGKLFLHEDAPPYTVNTIQVSTLILAYCFTRSVWVSLDLTTESFAVVR
jgi:hypothetical protein